MGTRKVPCPPGRWLFETHLRLLPSAVMALTTMATGGLIQMIDSVEAQTKTLRNIRIDELRQAVWTDPGFRNSRGGSAETKLLCVMAQYWIEELPSDDAGTKQFSEQLRELACRFYIH